MTLEQFLTHDDKRASLTEVRRLMLIQIDRHLNNLGMDTSTFDYKAWEAPENSFLARHRELQNDYISLSHLCESIIIIDEKLSKNKSE